MHLLDWDSYNKAGAPTAPAFMGETLYNVKADKATDSVRGLRIREMPRSGRVISVIPKGCKVKVGEVHGTHGKWRRFLEVVEGRTLPPTTGSAEAWVFIGEMVPTSEHDVFLVGEEAKDLEPTLAPEKGLNVRKTGSGRSSDPITGLLPLGTKFSLEGGTGAYRKLKEIVAGKDVVPLSVNSTHNIQGFVHFDSLDTARSEPVLDAVYLLPKPYPIKAGELIGHLGQYQNYNEGSAKPLLHLEVFSCEDVPGFIAKSRAWVAGFPDQQKTQLKVYKGASKLIPHREDISESNPPKTSDTGTTIGVDLIIPQSLLDALPADHKLQVSTTVPGSSTAVVNRWWRLDKLLADSEGNPISGWLAEQEPITTRHSPWEWVGCDFIKETGRPIGNAAYFYDALRRLTDEERANYRAIISQEDQGPVKTRLYDIIDTNRDNKLTASEIRSALEKPWYAQSIAQLITHYESEWFWKADKWDELDPLMGHIPLVDTNPNWESEKARIEKLSWWESLAGKQGLSSGGEAWHFHPLEFMCRFLSVGISDCGCKLGKIFSCVRFKGGSTIYGPLYTGSISLDKYIYWEEIVTAGVVSDEEKKIFIAMSPNEGNMDSIQSYDSEILTVGAMQKTINPSGAGEFPIQVFDFKERYPRLYFTLFENCVWVVKGPRAKARIYYKNLDLTNGDEYTGADLKQLIRRGFNEEVCNKKQKVESCPLGAILKAVEHEKFQEQQIIDFSRRMREEVLEVKLSGFEHKLKDFLKSPLGKATVLDHHINRPGYVRNDFGAALKRFFDKNPSISKSPLTWGNNHAEYEIEILDDYGKARRMAIVGGNSVAPSRYQHLKDKL